MKIGILTFFESDNYGTVLQAYALQRYLEMQGHFAELIQLKRNVNAKSAHYKTSVRQYTVMQRVWNKMVSQKNKNASATKKVKFEQFRKDYLKITSVCYETETELLKDIDKYDVIISGGDQIWNPYHKVFSLNYMLGFLPEGYRRISYGSSFGVTDITDEKLLNDMKEALEKYEKLSVREASGVQIISKMNLEAEQVVDPVFLIEDEWKIFVTPVSPRNRKYILVYALVDYADECDAKIKKYAKEHDLDIVILPENRRNCMNCYEKTFDLSPSEILNYIAHSEMVFTNSFHGLAFAMIFKKKFFILDAVTQEARSKQSRLFNLLEMFGINVDDIDFVEADKKKNYWIEKSQKYLIHGIHEKECL